MTSFANFWALVSPSVNSFATTTCLVFWDTTSPSLTFFMVIFEEPWAPNSPIFSSIFLATFNEHAVLLLHTASYRDYNPTAIIMAPLAFSLTFSSFVISCAPSLIFSPSSPLKAISFVAVYSLCIDSYQASTSLEQGWFQLCEPQHILESLERRFTPNTSLMITP